MGTLKPLLLLLLTVHMSLTSRTNDEDICLNPDPSANPTCLLPQDEQRGIPFESLSGTPDVIPSGAQVITSYTFSCCGHIRAWSTFVHPGGRREDREYSITFQVWRSAGNSTGLGGSGEGDGGQCSGSGHLVGENSFNKINLGSGGLVCETPDPRDEIWVEPGDVVGFHIVHKDGGARGVVVAEDYTNESIWYGVDAQESGDPQCVYSMGFEEDRELRSYTSHAPMLQVTIEPEECPQSTTKGALMPSENIILPTINAATKTIPTTFPADPDTTTHSFTTKTIPTDDRNSISNSQEELSEAVFSTDMTTSSTEAISTTDRMTSGVNGFHKEELLGTPLLAATIVILVITIIVLMSCWKIRMKRRAREQEPVSHSRMENLNYAETTVTTPIYYNILESNYDSPTNLSQSSNPNSLGYINSDFPNSQHPPWLHGDSQQTKRDSYVNMDVTPEQGYVTVNPVTESNGVGASTKLVTPYAISAPKVLDVGDQVPSSLIPCAEGNKHNAAYVVVPYAVKTLALTYLTAQDDTNNTAITSQAVSETPAEHFQTMPETDETTLEQTDESTSDIDLMHNEAYELKQLC